MSEEGTIRVMLVDDIADTLDQLEKLLYFEKDIEVVARASNGVEAVELAKQQRPDVILMDINMPEMDGIAATEAILSDDPAVQVIIMSVQGETDYLRRAMMAGAREFLVKPVSADDLYKSVRHVHKLGQSRPRMVAQGTAGGDAQRSDQLARGQIFAVYSPKGGVGTSTIAANLAIALRQLTQKKVALVDGNVSLGDLNVVLNLASNRTMADLIDRIADLDRDLLNDVMTAHASQVKVLLAPPNPQDGELITSEHIRPVLESLGQEFDYVVIDTQSSFHDRALAVLDEADRIVVLMTLEMTCIKNIKLFMEVADLLEYPREKIVLVLNKADNRLGIRIENVENNIKHKVLMQIANAPQEMTLSINQGVPLVISKRDHRAVKDIFALARELTRQTSSDADSGQQQQNGSSAPKKQQPAAQSKSGGLLGKFFGSGGRS